MPLMSPVIIADPGIQRVLVQILVGWTQPPVLPFPDSPDHWIHPCGEVGVPSVVQILAHHIDIDLIHVVVDTVGPLESYR